MSNVIHLPVEGPESFTGLALCAGCGCRWIAEVPLDASPATLECPKCRRQHSYWTPWPMEYVMAQQMDRMTAEKAVANNHQCVVYSFDWYKERAGVKPN